MTVHVCRKLDDGLIDRVFQPAVNRLQVTDPMHLASLLYGTYAGAALARVLALYVQGSLAQQWPYAAGGLVSAFLLYGFSVLRPKSETGANVNREALPALCLRLTLLLVALAILARLVLRFDASGAIYLVSFLAWTAAAYVEACDGATPQAPRIPAGSVHAGSG